MMNDRQTVYLEGNGLTLEDVIKIAEEGYQAAFKKETMDKIKTFRENLDRHIKEHPEMPIYGTTRLHGDLKDQHVSVEKLKLYQRKYMMVHNCGTGKPLPLPIVRAIMAIRLNSFARGVSGMRPETCQLMLDMLNKGVTPWVLEEGSVGASGDLVPLAMMGAVLIGLPEAKAYYKGELLSASEALRQAGLKSIELEAKEAIGLTNGTNFITAASIFALRDAERLLKNASIAAALSVEAVRGEQDAFTPIIHEENRRHEGQLEIAKHMRHLLDGSQRASREAQMDFFTDDHSAAEALKKLNALRETAAAADITHRVKEEVLKKIEKAAGYLLDKDRKVLQASVEITALETLLRDNPGANDSTGAVQKATGELKKTFGELRVQDRYSYRSVPQVHGAAVEALKKLRDVLYIEINSTTDNPIFDVQSYPIRAYSGANFHGQPVAAVIDYVKITLTSLGLISDKRSFSLLDRRLSYGLPADLAFSTSEADGGLMICQYAGAARAGECRVLSTPSSVMSISTAANQEDFVSMGSIGVLHLQKIITNVQVILGIEILCALRGIQLTENRLPASLRSLGVGTAKIYDLLDKDKVLGKAGEDRYLRTEMEHVINMVKDGELVSQAGELVKLSYIENYTKS